MRGPVLHWKSSHHVTPDVGRLADAGSVVATEPCGGRGKRHIVSDQSGTSSTSSTSTSSSASHSALDSAQGTTTIADTVVSTIAGLATKEIQGVNGLGSGASRTVGALRERIPGAHPNYSQGVTVEVGEKQAAVDVSVIVDYGVAIADVASAIRQNVISSVERMTGLQVTEVNITVVDIHLPDEDEGDSGGKDSGQQGSRAQ